MLALGPARHSASPGRWHASILLKNTHRESIPTLHCSTRWMANRDAHRSKSPSAAEWYSPTTERERGGTRVGTWCICFRCVALHHSLKGLCTRAKFWLGIPVVIVWKSAHVCFVGVYFFRRVFLCQLFVFSPSLIKCNAPVAGCLMTLIGRGSHIGG